MRKVKAAAIQPVYPNVPEIYRCWSENYRNDPQEIVDYFVREHLKVTTDLLEKAGQEGCDIVTTSEAIDGLGSFSMDVTEKNIYDRLVELSYPVIEKELSAIAKKYSMYIVGCYVKRKDSRNYNTGVIFDRQGNIAGEYRKTHLPPDEKWQNVEGDEIEVFQLDFGKIGITICYDMMFQEQVQVLATKGAEIIFHPTLGYGWYEGIGEATLRTRANDNSVYIVTAKNYLFNSPGRSSIIDHWGHIIADAGYDANVVVSREIDLDKEKSHPDWYFPTPTSGIGNVKERKARERRPELYGILTQKVMEKFDGLSREVQLEVLKQIRSGQCHW